MKHVLKYLSPPMVFVYGLLLLGLPSTPATDLLPGVGGEVLAMCGGEYGAGGMGPPTPPDFDCDGVRDSLDSCMAIAGSSSNYGCPNNYTGLDIYLVNNQWGSGPGIDDPVSFVSGMFGTIGVVAGAAALLGPPGWAAAAVVGTIYGTAGAVLWIIDYALLDD